MSSSGNKKVSFQKSPSLSSVESSSSSNVSLRPKKNNFLLDMDGVKGVKKRSSPPSRPDDGSSLGNPKYPSYEKKYFQNMLSRIQRTSGLSSKVKRIPHNKLQQVRN